MRQAEAHKTRAPRGAAGGWSPVAQSFIPASHAKTSEINRSSLRTPCWRVNTAIRGGACGPHAWKPAHPARCAGTHNTRGHFCCLFLPVLPVSECWVCSETHEGVQGAAGLLPFYTAARRDKWCVCSRDNSRHFTIIWIECGIFSVRIQTQAGEYIHKRVP